MKNPFFSRTGRGAPPTDPRLPSGSTASPLSQPGTPPSAAPPAVPTATPVPPDSGVGYIVQWHPSRRLTSLATAALVGLIAAVLTGHAAVVLLAAPVLGALALMPRRRPPSELFVHVTQSGSRCFEGEDVTIAITVRAPAGAPLDLIALRLNLAPQVTPAPQGGAPGVLGSGGGLG